MSRLPVLLSVPHSGLEVPAEARPYCVLSEAEIVADGDEGARAIYDLMEHVDGFVRTDVARAIVDMNRAPDDRRRDGVVKTHTCWDVPVYDPFPPEDLLRRLIERHHQPYHERLTALAGDAGAGFDCHTMAAAGPPVGPDPGRPRPAACLGDGDGSTFPRAWTEALQRLLAEELGREVTINEPFSGGHIVRAHAAELPWLQIELSRAPFLSTADKRRAVLAALTRWCETVPELKR